MLVKFAKLDSDVLYEKREICLFRDSKLFMFICCSLVLRATPRLGNIHHSNSTSILNFPFSRHLVCSLTKTFRSNSGHVSSTLDICFLSYNL